MCLNFGVTIHQFNREIKHQTVTLKELSAPGVEFTEAIEGNPLHHLLDQVQASLVKNQ